MFLNELDLKYFKNPYLIQRGEFRDITLEQVKGLDSLINYDYMGAAEFEFGALPKALRTTIEYWANYIVVPITELRDLDKQTCWIICYKEHKDKVIETVNKLSTREGELSFRLHERAEMYSYLGNTCGLIRTDFWWDIENCWFACFGEFNLQRLIHALRLVYEKKKGTLPNNGPSELIGNYFKSK